MAEHVDLPFELWLKIINSVESSCVASSIACVSTSAAEASREKTNKWLYSVRKSPVGFIFEPAAKVFSVTVAPCDSFKDAVSVCPEGGTILLLPGKHSIVPIRFPKSLHVFGRGEATLLSSTKSLHGGLVSLYNNVTLDGIIFEKANVGVIMCASSRLQSCKFINCSTAVDVLKDSSNVFISSCEFRRSQNGIMFNSNSTGTISSCLFDNCITSLTSVGSPVIKNNSFTNCKTAIQLSGLYTSISKPIITHNSIGAAKFHGLSFDLSDCIATVSDNSIAGANNKSIGIYISLGHHRIEVTSSNFFENNVSNHETGVSIETCAGGMNIPIFTNNVFDSNSSGLEIDRGTFSGNTISGFTNYGIRCNGPATIINNKIINGVNKPTNALGVMGVQFGSGSGIRIFENNIIEDIDGTGIIIGTGANNLSIMGNTIRRVSKVGLLINHCFASNKSVNIVNNLIDTSDVGLIIKQGSKIDIISKLRVLHSRTNGVVIEANSTCVFVNCEFGFSRMQNIIAKDFSTVTFKHCNIFNGFCGIFLSKSGCTATIEDCSVHKNVTNMSIRDGASAHLVRCKFFDATVDCIILHDPATRCHLEACDVYDNGRGGICLRDGASATILTSNIFKNHGDGIAIFDKATVNIEGCDLYSNATCVLVAKGSSTIIARNSIHHSPVGVTIIDAILCDIKFNHIYNCSESGAKLLKGNAAIICHNTFHDNAKGISSDIVIHSPDNIFVKNGVDVDVDTPI